MLKQEARDLVAVRGIGIRLIVPGVFQEKLIGDMAQMTLVKRIVLVVALLTAAAPVIGLADNPVPTCWPCSSGSAK